MNVKGFILEDDHGREFVLVCEQPLSLSGKIFSIRGWQRRRLVPLHSTERELSTIVGEVLATLRDVFKSLSRLPEHISEGSVVQPALQYRAGRRH